ncbi:MAG TPA: amidohydrolase family protein [Burkholderiales bacterium]|nr:amidohydrolase family protein [Burkholderiales bacterium]
MSPGKTPRRKLFAVAATAAALLGPAAGAQTLVVQGGTLIDGTGRAPVTDAVVVIENGRFRAVGKRGEVQVPPNAQVIDATGKHLLPGFLDGHCHWEDFFGELYLHLGITTCTYIAIFQDGPWALAQRDGVALGKIRGPRMWVSGQAIGGSRTETDAPDSREWRGNIIVKTPEEARAAVRAKKEAGYDLLKVNEFISADLLKVIAEEAHKTGLAVTVHSWDAIGTAQAGVDSIEHIWSVGWSSIADVDKRRRIAADRLAGKVEAEEAAALYEVENFDKIIKTMVDNKVAWTPTVAKWFRPLSPSRERFRARENEILDNKEADFPPTLRAVVDNTYDKLFKRFTPEQLERTKLGYEKAKEFTRRFVAAGGLLKEGSDPPRGMAGLLLHQALVMDVEAGVPPMTAIQAATLNVAKVYKKDKDYGSVEPGKIADLVIIEGDPLDDIWVTQNVKMLIMDGKLVDTHFSRYKNPIPSSDAYQTLPREIAITPDVATQGTRTVLKVAGRGMWPYHVVLLDGKPLETRLVGRNQLEAVIPPEDIANAGTYRVTVRSPGESYPESHPARLVVRFRQ